MNNGKFSVSEGIALAAAVVAAHKAWPVDSRRVNFQIDNLRVGPIRYLNGEIVRRDAWEFTCARRQGMSEEHPEKTYRRIISVRLHDLGIVEVKLEGEFDFTWIGGSPTVHWTVGEVCVRQWDWKASKQGETIPLREIARFEGSQLQL